jgi:hypothetical protein
MKEDSQYFEQRLAQLNKALSKATKWPVGATHSFTFSKRYNEIRLYETCLNTLRLSKNLQELKQYEDEHSVTLYFKRIF